MLIILHLNYGLEGNMEIIKKKKSGLRSGRRSDGCGGKTLFLDLAGRDANRLHWTKDDGERGIRHG